VVSTGDGVRVAGAEAGATMSSLATGIAGGPSACRTRTTSSTATIGLGTTLAASRNPPAAPGRLGSGAGSVGALGLSRWNDDVEGRATAPTVGSTADREAHGPCEPRGGVFARCHRPRISRLTCWL
jgi:hypothetical protein